MRRLLVGGVLGTMLVLACLGVLATGSVPSAVQSAEKKTQSPIPGKPTILTGSDSVVVFGPVCYEHPGPDNSWAFFSDNFTATDVRGRRYLVEVSSSSARRVSVAGVEVLGQNDAGTIAVAEVSSGSNGVSVGYRAFTGDPITVRVVHVADPTYVVYPRTKFTRMATVDTVSAYFTVDTANAATVGLFHALNGTTTNNRVTSGKVWLNGSIIATGGTDFASGKATVSKSVTLLPNNTFDVLNQSSDTTSLMKVMFRATDDTPPAVTMYWPPNPFITDSAAVSLIGRVTDQTPCSLSVNEGPWSPVDSTFLHSFPLPSDGPFTARITVRNSAGLSTTVNRSLVRDTQAPVLTVRSPAADTTVADSSITLAGWWDDLTQATVTLDDDTVRVDTSGTISYAYLLDMGPNRILVRARDALGHVTETTKRVFRELAGEPDAPDSNQAPPLDYSRFNTFFETVSFIFEDNPKRQQSADPDSIVPERAAVIRGRVLGRDFGPLANCSDPRFGEALLGGYLSTRRGRWNRSRGRRMDGGSSRRSSSGSRSNGCSGASSHWPS